VAAVSIDDRDLGRDAVLIHAAEDPRAGLLDRGLRLSLVLGRVYHVTFVRNGEDLLPIETDLTELDYYNFIVMRVLTCDCG
jgi:hypothetical protein